MTVSYFRTGRARTGVAEREWLAVDGQTFQAWRSVGASAVGRFGGPLTDDESARVADAVAACAAAGSPDAPVARPGSTVVQIDLDGTSTQFGSGSPPPGPWSELDTVLSELCDAIVDRPVAAIAVEPDGDDGYRLVHRGTDPIDVDLSDGTFVAVAWSGWYAEVGRSEGELTGGTETATPGWTVAVPVGSLPADGENDGEDDVENDGEIVVHVTARFALVGDRDAAPVEASFAPELRRPD